MIPTTIAPTGNASSDDGAGGSNLDAAFDSAFTSGSGAGDTGQDTDETPATEQEGDTLAGTEEVQEQEGQQEEQHPDQQQEGEEGIAPEGKGYRVSKARLD